MPRNRNINQEPRGSVLKAFLKMDKYFLLLNSPSTFSQYREIMCGINWSLCSAVGIRLPDRDSPAHTTHTIFFFSLFLSLFF